MINLFLIRHAECVTNSTPEFIGGRSSDSPLTEKGRKQALKLKLFFEKPFVQGLSLNRPFDQVFCSTAIRAVETAELAIGNIVKTYDIDTNFSNKLEELNQGDWEGKKRSEIYTEEVMQQIKRYPLHFRSPNGESKMDVGSRMFHYIWKNMIEGSSPEDPDKNILVFTHGFAIKCFLYYIMRFDPSLIYNVSIGNASITKVSYDTDWKVHYINQSVQPQL